MDKKLISLIIIIGLVSLVVTASENLPRLSALGCVAGGAALMSAWDSRRGGILSKYWGMVPRDLSVRIASIGAGASAVFLGCLWVGSSSSQGFMKVGLPLPAAAGCYVLVYNLLGFVLHLAVAYRRV